MLYDNGFSRASSGVVLGNTGDNLLMKLDEAGSMFCPIFRWETMVILTVTDRLQGQQISAANKLLAIIIYCLFHFKVI